MVDGFYRTAATNNGAIGDYVAYDDECDCLDLPKTAFSNAQDPATMGTGVNGKCAKVNKAYPWCYVSETCRGAAGSGFKSSNGTALNAGKSSVPAAGTSVYWAQCENVGDTEAIVAAPKPTFKTLDECYNQGSSPYRLPLKNLIGTLTTNENTGKLTYSGSANNSNVLPQAARPYGWNSNFLNKVRQFITSNGMEILAELEEKYDCASVCEVPLFYITKDIEEGRPTQECAAGIYHSMKGSYKAEAAFSIILSLVLWVAMTCALMIACAASKAGEDAAGVGAEENPGNPKRGENYAPAEGTEMAQKPVEDKDKDPNGIN